MDEALLVQVRNICSRPFSGDKKSTPDTALMHAAFEELEMLGPGRFEAVTHLLPMRELREILTSAGEPAIKYLHYALEKGQRDKQQVIFAREEGEAAIGILGAIGGPAFSELQHVMRYHDAENIRGSAAYQLAKNGQLDVLAKALSEDDEGIRIAAIGGLHGLAFNQRFSPNETPGCKLPVNLLIQSLQDSCSEVRRIALSALKEIDQVDLDIVERTLHDEDCEVRKIALGRLFDIGVDHATAPLLADMFEDPDAEIVNSAIAGLGAKRYDQKVNPEVAATAIIDILVLRSSGRPDDTFNSTVVASALEQTIALQPPLQGKILARLRDLAYTDDSGVRTRSVLVGKRLNTEDFATLVQEKAAGNPQAAQPVLRLLGLGSSTDAILKQIAEASPGDVLGIAASQIKLLDQYYNTVLRQANTSFRWALVAGGVGLVFFLAAIVFFIAQYRDIGTVSTFGGAVVEVIAGLIFRLYGKTTAQLADFHHRLDQTQRFLLSNSICESLEGDERQKAKIELIKVISTYGVSPEQTPRTNSL